MIIEKLFKNNENIVQIKKEAKRRLKLIPRLDEKRIAIRRFITEGTKLTKNHCDAIVCPLYSGLIPATLFRELYSKKNRRKPPIFTFLVPREHCAKEKQKYEIVFNKYGKKIIDVIQKDFVSFLNKYNLDKDSKILFIDTNISKGFTLAYFIETAKKIGLKNKNIIIVITDIRAEEKELKILSKKILKGGKFIFFSQKDEITNKVFDNVLSPTCDIRCVCKKFKNGKVVLSVGKLTYYPYYLALALFKEEYKKLSV